MIENRSDYARARSRFQWPAVRRFNWAIDWFEHLASVAGGAPALVVTSGNGELHETITFAQMSAWSDRVAAWWYRSGIRRGDRVLVAMENVPGIWESLLATMKLGAVMVPASPRLSGREVAERLVRGRINHVVSDVRTAMRLDSSLGDATRLVMSKPSEAAPPGWCSLHETECRPGRREYPVAATELSDPLLMYFTSGTTGTPKLVRHNHSYPIGHLPTMYWIGLRPGDVHLNIAAPGWAKHLGSGLFAAWNAEAAVVVHGSDRFVAPAVLDVMKRHQVTTMCAPPTAWRMLIKEDLTRWSLRLREAVSAGEPLDETIIAHVRHATGVAVRDGYGQTETTHLVGNTPGQTVKPGSMGRAMPGFDMVVNGEADNDTDSDGIFGELQVVVPPEGIGIMDGYASVCRRQEPGTVSWHCTADLVRCDKDGYLTFVGRVDEVFKSSGYRIAPLELERVLAEHPAVAEVAVIPSADPVRAWVPKACVSLAPGWEPSRYTASAIMLHARSTLASHAQIRRVTFCELPKTISGKVRRGELRRREAQFRDGTLGPGHLMQEWLYQDVDADLPEASTPAAQDAGQEARGP